jgi:hypothetical protein
MGQGDDGMAISSLTTNDGVPHAKLDDPIIIHATSVAVSRDAR